MDMTLNLPENMYEDRSLDNLTKRDIIEDEDYLLSNDLHSDYDIPEDGANDEGDDESELYSLQEIKLFVKENENKALVPSDNMATPAL